MALRLESLPDDPHIQALMYGPVVLAGDLGTAGLDSVEAIRPERTGDWSGSVHRRCRHS